MSDSVPAQIAYGLRDARARGCATQSHAVIFGLDARSIVGGWRCPAGAPPAGQPVGCLAGLQASLRWSRPVRGWLTGPAIAPAGSRRLQQPLVECALQSAL